MSLSNIDDTMEILDKVDFSGHTSDPDPNLKRGQISEIISPAYLLSNGEALVKAVVKTYKPRPDDESEGT